MMNPKIKDILGICTAIAVILLAYAGIKYSQSIQPGAYRMFTASGEAEVVSIPDVAQFTFSVITENGKDLAKLTAENTEKTNKAIEKLTSMGIEKKDIKTQRYDVSPKYQYYNCPTPIIYGSVEPCPPPSISGYTITQTVQVKVRDFEKIGDAMSGVVDSGANQVGTLSFSIDDIEKVKNQAREEAIAEARAKAKDIAEAGGFKVGKLVSIEDQSDYPYPLYGGYGGDAIMESSMKSAPVVAPSIEPGSQEVTVRVILRYEID